MTAVVGERDLIACVDIEVGTRLHYLGGVLVVDQVHEDPDGYRWFTDATGREFGLGVRGEGGHYFLAGSAPVNRSNERQTR